VRGRADMATLRLTPPPSPAQTGVWIGIAAITMSFAAYTSAFIVRRGGAPDWQHITLPPILYLNTLLLLASSATLERGRRLMAGDAQWRTPATSRGPGWLTLTLGLGLLFLAGQVVAWRQLAAQGLYLNTGPSSGFFYVLTALHGLHLLGGIIALVYALHRVRVPAALAPSGVLGATALYWHFMDVLWLYLLALLILTF
jgi:cytochrome c oxidase subunit 3